MSYNNRRCRYCWQMGHNVRTCPKAKKEAAEGVSYRAKQIVAKALYNKEAAKNRVCSYCNTAGHNIATCKKQVTDNNNKRQKIAQYRQAFVQWAKDNNFGIGALIQIEDVTSNLLTGIITNINTAIFPNTYCPCIQLQFNNYKMDIELPVKFSNQFIRGHAIKNYNIVSVTENAILPKQMKEPEWLQAKDASVSSYILNRVHLP